MTKSYLLAGMALTLILTGCGGPDGTGGANSLGNSNGTLITCAGHDGEGEKEYYIPKPGEELPTNVGAEFKFVKIDGDDHCYSLDQFQDPTQPDKCPEVHYHGNKTASDGCVREDTDFETCCGVATFSQVTSYTGYRFFDEEPRDVPPPTVYGEDIEVPDNYCGPDITEALLSSLKRANSRLGALPDNEKGTIDGTAFLDRNGTNIDFRIQKQENCPSEACMASDGQGTVTLCGQCIMEHIANDIMFGFVAHELEVPFSIQLAGAHYAEYTSYGGLDPLASQAAYVMGNDVGEAMTPGGALSIGDFCSALNGAVLETGIVTDSNAFELQGAEQSFLADCIPPPPSCEVKVQKDFATSRNWNLDD